MKALRGFLIISLIGLSVMSCDKSEADTKIDVEKKGIPVEVAVVTPETFTSQLTYNGSLLAIQSARIIPEMPGRIEALSVQIGDNVSQGDLLVQMDDSMLKLQKEQAAAGLSVASANMQDALKNWERVQTLRDENAVSEQQYEKTRLGLEAAQSQLNQARAGLELLAMQLEKARLTAPFSGVITQQGFEAGDLFSPAAMMPVYTLQDISRIKVELQVTSNEILKVQKGQKAFLSVDYLEVPITGEVTIVSLAADPLSKTFFVECHFPNPEGRLRAGTFGQVAITIEEVDDVVVLPKTAVIDGSHIFVVKGDQAFRRDVSILRESLDDVIIGEGLSENEIYVSSGAYILTDSSLVEIMKKG